MQTEEKLCEYIIDTKYDDLPLESVDLIKNVIITIFGTTLAGAISEGCDQAISQVMEWGGREEATILIHGGKVPAHNAAFVNSVMARALDFCDSMSPGIHIGSSSVPTALAAAELIGGCTGKNFLTALALGTEVGARINSISDYDGFDPTGVCSVFASTVVAGRLLRLNSQEMLNALALAFNRSGGSFQNNIDGALAVRLIQGWVSQSGIICTQLARKGLTGPRNFIDGTYGYLHLYGKGKHESEGIISDLGKRFEMINTNFKVHPSCGCTLASTDAILDIVNRNRVSFEDVAAVEVKVSPYAYRLTGHAFKLGDNPKVDAQFSIQYCVANVLLRRGSKLSHFDEAYVKDERVLELIKKIHVSVDENLPEPGRSGVSGSTHLTVNMRLTTNKGAIHYSTVNVPKGYPKNPMSSKEHLERYRDCVYYANTRIPELQVDGDKLLSELAKLERIEDVRTLIPQLLLPAGVQAKEEGILGAAVSKGTATSSTRSGS